MKKRILSLLLVLVCVCIFTCIALAAEETFINPVANGADPFVFKDTDGTYYLYVTSGGNYGYRVYTSANLVEWESQGYCLKPEDVYIDHKTLKFYDKKFVLFPVKVHENTAKALALTEKVAAEYAQKTGIIEMANKQGAAIIKGILSNVLPDGYKIEVVE